MTSCYPWSGVSLILHGDTDKSLVASLQFNVTLQRFKGPAGAEPYCCTRCYVDPDNPGAPGLKVKNDLCAL